MPEQVLSESGSLDNPYNHPSWGRWLELIRAALIQRKKALQKQVEATQEEIRAVGMQIAALDAVDEKKPETW
jgi:hypothetical protein